MRTFDQFYIPEEESSEKKAKDIHAQREKEYKERLKKKDHERKVKETIRKQIASGKAPDLTPLLPKDTARYVRNAQGIKEEMTFDSFLLKELSDWDQHPDAANFSPEMKERIRKQQAKRAQRSGNPPPPPTTGGAITTPIKQKFPLDPPKQRFPKDPPAGPPKITAKLFDWNKMGRNLYRTARKIGKVNMKTPSSGAEEISTTAARTYGGGLR
jgi:hypothetical protein